MDITNEVKNLNEKIDRLESHFAVYKADISDLKEVVKQLTSALVGSNYNGNKGFRLLSIYERINKGEAAD